MLLGLKNSQEPNVAGTVGRVLGEEFRKVARPDSIALIGRSEGLAPPLNEMTALRGF